MKLNDFREQHECPHLCIVVDLLDSRMLNLVLILLFVSLHQNLEC